MILDSLLLIHVDAHMLHRTNNSLVIFLNKHNSTKRATKHMIYRSDASSTAIDTGESVSKIKSQCRLYSQNKSFLTEMAYQSQVYTFLQSCSLANFSAKKLFLFHRGLASWFAKIKPIL
jgi:hypothetical protein